MTRCVLLLLMGAPAWAQTVCSPTPTFSLCEISIASNGPQPDLRAEFRSPSHRTFLIPAFWDGAKSVIRVSPTEAGTWDFRLTGGKEGQFAATASRDPGFVEPANVHHFWYSGTHAPHLWMGAIVPGGSSADFDTFLQTRAAAHFNHLRFTLLTGPDQARLPELDRRILAANRGGITADLCIAPDGNSLVKWFPQREDRERVITSLVARYGAMNITWRGFEEFESAENGRQLLKEVAEVIAKADQYHHLQSTGAQVTSAPLFDDGWMKAIGFHEGDLAIPAIEHQVFPAPGLITLDGPSQLWAATMTGAYPEFTNSGGKAAKIWFDFFAATRHWDLEPFYDVEGGSALALEGVEYIVFAAKPGPVTVTVEKHNYDVEWFDPLTGETVGEKNLKTEIFSGEPPNASHPWVLHISRESHKAGMLKSYKFESRETLLQEIESDPAKVPFEIAEPAVDAISLRSPGHLNAKLRKETRATRRMMYLWTGEVTADEQSYRVIGTGANGDLRIPPHLARRFPALLHVRLLGMNANGKLYSLDRNYQLNP